MNGVRIPLLERKPSISFRGTEEFEEFGCKVRHNNPKTPDLVEPEIRLVRKFFDNGELVLPDGAKVKVWGFEDPESDERRPFPSALIRVPRGKIVHITIQAAKNTHTIHHHGIEPTPHNDGVGHTSFEVSGSYAYQWQASQSGTYLYHCHKNTTLHFAMGMLGLLIVDPPRPDGESGPQAPYPRGGPGFVQREDAAVPYHVEALWVGREIDPAWHSLGHDAGLCGGQDVGLNRFNPRYFLISGVPQPKQGVITDPRVAIRAKVGETILLRYANAGFSEHVLEIGGLDAEIIASDGRPFAAPYSRPFTIKAGKRFNFGITAAERYEMLLKPDSPGVYPVTVRFRHWIRNDLIGVAKTTITVT